jgi:hypothetical protein
MQKSVLLEILRSLNKKEMRDLNKWLQSPSHNQRQDVVRLFDYLSKNLGAGDEAVEKARAWAAVFKGEPYDDAFMRQVMYFLLKAVEDYLVFAELSQEKIQYQLILTRLYRQRKMDKAYRQALRIGRDLLENQPLRDNRYLRYKFLFEQDYGQQSNIVQNASANLQETSDALERWFFAEKLHLSYAMKAHQAVYKTAHYTEGIREEVLEHCQKPELLAEPAIAVYYYAYMVITNPSEEKYYFQFEEFLQNNTQRFDASEMRTLYVAAINYCVPKINQGRQEFARRAFDLYRKGLEAGYLLENNQLSRYTFGNAVGAALRNKEFGWTERFIENFQQYLLEKERNSIVNFNLSRLYFEKGDYNQAQQMLTQFEYDDMLLNIIAKTMLLKIYYERGDLDAFESLVESLRIYLQRKEALDPARKASYKNLVSLMKKLLHLNIYSKPQREKFRELVLATNPLSEREWFLKQIEGR